MVVTQGLTLLLYAISVVAGYPSEQKPGYLNPNLSVSLKIIAGILLIYGTLSAAVSVSSGGFLSWVGVFVAILAMAFFEAVVGGTKLWQSHQVLFGGSDSLHSMRNTTGFDPDSVTDGGTNESNSNADEQESADGFESDPFNEETGGFESDPVTGDGPTEFDSSPFGEDSTDSLDSSPFDDEGTDEFKSNTSDLTDNSDLQFDTDSFGIGYEGDIDSIETQLDEVESHLNDLQQRHDSITHDSLVDHFEDEFDQVEAGSDRSIVINGDVIIDNHEEHKTTDAREITDDTTVNDSVINRSDIDSDSPSFDDQTDDR